MIEAWLNISNIYITKEVTRTTGFVVILLPNLVSEQYSLTILILIRRHPTKVEFCMASTKSISLYF